MRSLTAMLVLGMSVAILADEQNPIEEHLAKEPLPNSYSIITREGTFGFNYTPDLGGYSFHGLQLRVWMVADKAIVDPGDNLTLTIHFQNISKSDIWVPAPTDWQLSGFADIESGLISLSRSTDDPYSSPRKLKVGDRSSFEIKLESPINEVGFVQFNVKWGIDELIAPNPVIVECRRTERIEQGGSGKPATRPESK